MKYFETSHKDGTNVKLIFEEIAKLILPRKLKQQKNKKNTKKARLLNSPKKMKTVYNKNNYKLELDKLLKFMSK